MLALFLPITIDFSFVLNGTAQQLMNKCLIHEFIQTTIYIYYCSLQVKNVRVSPMERDNDGATPLHFAAARGMHQPIGYTQHLATHFQSRSHRGHRVAPQAWS